MAANASAQRAEAQKQAIIFLGRARLDFVFMKHQVEARPVQVNRFEGDLLGMLIPRAGHILGCTDLGRQTHLVQV